jgi:predicted amidophosphoribosyltransferase
VTVRFRKIDEESRAVHHFIKPDDECYFLYEYTSGQNYAYSETNSIISNLKKKPSQRAHPSYRWKLNDMKRCSDWLGGAINEKWLQNAALVPIPPSRMPTDPEYDDRMLQICRNIPSNASVDVRDLVYQTVSLKAAHENPNDRPSVEEIKAAYAVNLECSSDLPSSIGIVDDVLTAGAHFRAMKDFILEHFPDTSVVGFFIARRIFASPFEVVDIEECP